jgi:hypothetical protein
LQKELKALKQSFDELQASHECLKEDHEKLGLAHTSLLKLAKEKEIKMEQ